MLALILCFSGLISFVTSESCFYQRCINCHEEQTMYPGPRRVECDPSNWASAEWLLNIGHPPPSTDSRVPIEYRCLKFVATPDNKSFGNTMDVIRGCIPRVQIDSVCNGLAAVERARGHNDGRCFICSGNDCNSAVAMPASVYSTIAAVVMYYVLR